MITPTFSASQSDSSVTLIIHCPSVRAQDVEIDVHDNSFTLHISPYFLRLTLPGIVIEDDASSATFNPSTGDLTVILTKETHGEVFDGLDLIGKMLGVAGSGTNREVVTPFDIPMGGPSTSAAASVPTAVASGNSSRGPLIEVLSSEQESPEERQEKLNKEHELLLRAAQQDWSVPPTLPSADINISLKPSNPYGFLDLHSRYYLSQAGTALENAAMSEELTNDQRWAIGQKAAEDKWDSGYYQGDYVYDEEIQELLHWASPIVDLPTTTDASTSYFTPEEQTQLLNLPRKEYLLTPQIQTQLYLTLTSILMAATYDAVFTTSSPTPESPWTILILSSPLSTLTTQYTSLHSVLIDSYKRMLAYPLFRNWKLCEFVRKKTGELMIKSGRRGITKCLLAVKAIFEEGGGDGGGWKINKIWIEDYLCWVQGCATDELLASLGQQLIDYSMSKSFVEGWNLEELEAETRNDAEDHQEEVDSDDEDEEESSSDDDVDDEVDSDDEDEVDKNLRVGAEGLTISS